MSRKLRNPIADKVSYSPADEKKRRELITAIVKKYIETNADEFLNFKKQLAARAGYVKTKWGELDPKSVDYLERLSFTLPEKLLKGLDLMQPRILTDESNEKEDDWFAKEFPVFTFKYYTTIGKRNG